MINVNVSHFVSDLYKDIAALMVVFNFHVLIWRDDGLEPSPRNVLKLSCLKESHNDIGKLHLSDRFDLPNRTCFKAFVQLQGPEKYNPQEWSVC